MSGESAVGMPNTFFSKIFLYAVVGWF